jgi:hypothetical protein
MDRSQLAQQLEFYSNSIVGFIVLQGLVFCYNFGTSEQFNKILKEYSIFSICMSLLFVIVLAFALCTNKYLLNTLIELNAEHRKIITTIYKAKAIIILIFGALPIIITLIFAVFRGLSKQI